MAHPWHHSLSSANLFGGSPADYYRLHHWMDETKSHVADFRHRALRHHTHGVSLAVHLFGGDILNSDGINVSVRQVLEQHIVEDCGRLTTVEDWTVDMQSPRWFTGIRKNHADALDYLYHRYNRGDYHASLHWLVNWFYTPFGIDLQTNPLLAMLRSHAAGLFETEAAHKRPVIDLSYQRVPVRVLAEAIVKLQLGRIPSVEDWTRCLKASFWMVQTKKIERAL